MKKHISRRAVLKTGLAVGVVGAADVTRAFDYRPARSPTPPEIKGPFYPIVAQKDKDFDLTRIEGHENAATGEPIIIDGTVVDTAGQPVSDATVDLWQACASGKYSHPYDPNTAKPDPDFQGRAIVPSGEKGGFRFKTIMPGPYPAAPDWIRPPHIHFKVSKRGYVELITQMYFPGHRLNDVDLLLLRKGEEERKLMIAAGQPGELKTFSYRIVLQKA